MIINFHRDFAKSYKKLSGKLKQRVDFIVKKFRNNPHDILLKNHTLKGQMLERTIRFIINNELPKPNYTKLKTKSVSSILKSTSLLEKWTNQMF